MQKGEWIPYNYKAQYKRKIECSAPKYGFFSCSSCGTKFHAHYLFLIREDSLMLKVVPIDPPLSFMLPNYCPECGSKNKLPDSINWENYKFNYTKR